MTSKKLRHRDPGTQQMRKCQGRCKLMKGINAFLSGATVCRSCVRNAPPAPAPAGPSPEELERLAEFDAFSRSVREAAGRAVGGAR